MEKRKHIGKNWVRTKEIDKKMFEEYSPKTYSQEKLKQNILSAFEVDLDAFEVCIQPPSQDGMPRNAYRMEDWANDYNLQCKSKMGSRNHYFMYLAWRIQTGKTTWEKTCDKKDLAEAFRELKDDDGTYYVAGGCNYGDDNCPESEVCKDGNPCIDTHIGAAFVVFS
ncbi:MAG: hypothetical protein LBL91_01780 [Lachnospiraceae bacterium]|jgi:hypothetical protein|nr:hypothetical protein [Lachnospiraceae bacterium]